uniref:exodeoxyribonuclease III n=1 Tax=Oreochromis aureus TaxID=47969 RepID=A0A668RZ55_OREAU
MSNIKIITFNVRGLQSDKSRKRKVDFLKRLDYDILCLQEMRLKTHADICELTKMWNTGHSIISIGEDSSDGVGIFFKKDTVNIIKRRDIIPGRLLLVDCSYYGQRLSIINVYNAPERTKKIQLLKKLKYLLETGFNIILCGDFNIVTEATDRISKVEFRELRESKLLVKVCKEAALRDLYRHLHPHTVHYTRFDSLTKTRIDRFYISHNVQEQP